MTPADIERMAREAGAEKQDNRRGGVWVANGDDLTRFAALVRARALEDAARACESQANPLCDRYGDGAECIASVEECAAAIRALPC